MNMERKFSGLPRLKVLFQTFSVKYGAWTKPGAIIQNAAIFQQRIKDIGILF
jgi:hypothetical protein